MRYIILAQSPITEKALGAWLELLGWSERDEVVLCSIVPNLSQLSEQAGVLSYRRVAGRIAAALVPQEGVPSGDYVAVLVDSVNPGHLSAVGDSGSWDNLLAMLILTFPEVLWVFGVIAGAADTRFPGSEHGLPSLLLPRRDPLLDPTGLREWVRSQTNEKLKKQNETKQDEGGQFHPLQLPIRSDTNLAAAIDDEVDFAVMHGYSAYRYGFRADIVTSWALMDAQFGDLRSKRSMSSHGYDLLIEDMRLAFGDKNNDIELSELASRIKSNGKATGRAFHCPLLDIKRDDSRRRFVITTGQMRSDQMLLVRNNLYLDQKKESKGKLGAIHCKPMGGLCDLWEKTGMRKFLIESGKNDKLTNAQSERGNARAFFWPPAEPYDETYHGHGAPGKLAVIAAFMIERAEIMRDRAVSTSSFIRAALVAGDAAEILSGKTPALTLAAIALKHECEVRAECSFMGAGFHFGLERRLKELTEEVNSVARWFHERTRKTAGRDAEAALIHRLRQVFQEVGQWEEEHECLVAFRRLNRKLQRPQRQAPFWQKFNPMYWLAHPVLAYGEWLLERFHRVLTAAALTPVGFAILSARFSAEESKNPPETWYEWVSQAVTWTFGGGASEIGKEGLHVLSWFAVSLGVFHVGLLMSYLYSLVSRR